MPNDNVLVLEDIHLLWPNFTGKEGPYNREGDRSFNILLTPEQADAMSNDGWLVKTTKERELDGENVGGEPYLPVALNYKKGRPPRVVLITSRGRTELGEDEVEIIDYADIQTIDVTLNPYDWNLPTGASGRKAYLKSMFVTINEDQLDLKYADVPIAGQRRAQHEDE